MSNGIIESEVGGNANTPSGAASASSRGKAGASDAVPLSREPDAPDTYPTPPHGWTCFHCGETFSPIGIGRTHAREHFGATPHHEPGCILKLTSEDRSLLTALRAAEEELARYRAEDSDKDRELRKMEADHRAALRREEERGFARGVDAAKRYPETLGLRRASS